MVVTSPHLKTQSISITLKSNLKLIIMSTKALISIVVLFLVVFTLSLRIAPETTPFFGFGVIVAVLLALMKAISDAINKFFKDYIDGQNNKPSGATA